MTAFARVSAASPRSRFALKATCPPNSKGSLPRLLKERRPCETTEVPVAACGNGTEEKRSLATKKSPHAISVGL